jgi:tRNA nucleotidyltransferase (CCA-adding enzyme)
MTNKTVKTIQLSLPTAIVELMGLLEQMPSLTYLVGGSLRNYFLNAPIKDYDLAINKPIDQVVEYLKTCPVKVIETGIKFGGITVIYKNISVEVTAFRTDLGSLKSRFPQEVVFNDNIIEDARRRDFTINALYFQLPNKLYDFFDGRTDISKKLIKAIDDPSKRFEEDALRMLRGIRFASIYEFNIQEETLQAIINKRHLLADISKERITSEFISILSSKHAKTGLDLLKQTKLMDEISPLLENCDYEKIDELSFVDGKISYLLKDCELTDIKAFTRKYRFTIEKQDIIYSFVKYLKNPPTELLDIKLCIADINIINTIPFLELLQLVNPDYLQIFEPIYQKIIKNDEPIYLSQLAIDGNELMLLGVNGRELGDLKKYLFTKVLLDPTLNKKETLLVMAKNQILTKINS